MPGMNSEWTVLRCVKTSILKSMKLRPISACHRLCRLLGSTCDAHQWQLGVATAGFAHSFPGAHLNVCPVCCFLKNITNIIADLAVQRTTPPLLVVHLSRVVCTWLPWKYRAQVLVNTKGWCFDVGNVGNKMIQWDDIRWTSIDYDSRLNDFNVTDPCGSKLTAFQSISANSRIWLAAELYRALGPETAFQATATQDMQISVLLSVLAVMWKTAPCSPWVDLPWLWRNLSCYHEPPGVTMTRWTFWVMF